jgi:Transglycosylase SLT domain
MGRFLGRAHRAVTLASRSAGGSVPADDTPGNAPGGGRAGRRLAALTAITILGLALHTGDPAEAFQRSGHGIGATNHGAKAARPAAPAMVAPVHPGGTSAGIAVSPAAGTSASQAADLTGRTSSGRGRPEAGRAATGARAFRQIILPDLLIVAPKGLTTRQIARLRKITGVRNMITFDGARITAGGRSVNVIGVNPGTFRSWVPLRTASNQAFWTALAGGDFVAAAGTGKTLRLQPGDFYRLVGSSAQVVRFGMAAKLGLSGVDLLVNQANSARLGLVRQVAGLISAPGVSLATLSSKVSKVLGPSGRIEILRGQLPVASVPRGTVPTSYIQLFKAAATDYCPGLSWTVLAAIGQIESADGTNVGPSSAGALGPMQFLPSTWAIWGTDGFGQTGTPDVMNPYDAVPSAARLLCADGAAAGGRSLYNAIFDYNHADWYVNEVLALAAEYAADYR